MKQILIALVFVASSAVAISKDEAADPSMNMDRMGGFMQKLKLSDEQKSQMKKIHYDAQKRAIELKEKVQLSRLELRNLITADSPDKEAIEKQIQEVASNEASLKTNRLDVWFEVNKILTPDQQKEWRAMLRHRVSMRERWNGARGMRGHNFHRPFSPRRGMGMEDREMPKHGMPEHDMPQHEQE